MKYKVTKLYLKSREELIAAFLNFNDATLFIAAQLSQDEVSRIKTLYRIYDESELLYESNKENQVFHDSEDAETFGDTQFSFDVKIQSNNSLERMSLAYFNEEENAIAFITEKCSKSDNKNDVDNFLLFKNQVLISTLNKIMIANKALNDLISSEKSSSVTLSPLSTRPTPQGGPRDYWVEKNDEVE